MSEKVEIVLDGKDAGLVRAWLAGRDSVAAYEAGLKKLEPVTRENAKAAADFERAAKQAYEATRTPLEKFNREQEKLDDLFATGLIDVQTYNRALQQQKQILEQSDTALQKQRRDQEQLGASAKRVIDSLLTPQERYNQKLVELRRLLAAGALTQTQFNRAVAGAKKELDASATSGGNLIGKLTGMAAGYLSVTSALSSYISETKRGIEGQSQLGDKLDENIRKYRTLAGLSVMDDEQTKKVIKQAVAKTGVNPDQAWEGMHELVSAGMDSSEIEKGGLINFLDVVSAAAAKGKGADMKTMAGSLVKFLNANDLAPTAQNVRQYGAQMQRLAGPTNLSFTNVGDLAKHAAGFKGDLTPEEQIAMFGELTMTMEGAEAGTAMKSIMSNLTTEKVKPDALPWLKKMGLKPEDINFVGEDLDTVLGRFQEGLAKLNEDDRKPALKKIVEESGVAGMLYLTSNRERLRDAIAKQQDMPGFERDVETMETSRMSVNERLAARRDFNAAQKEEGMLGGSKAVFDAMDVALDEKGYGYWSRSMYGLGAKTLNTFGLMPTEAVKAVAPTDEGLGLGGMMVRAGDAMGLFGRSGVSANSEMVLKTADVLEQARGDSMMVQALRDNTEAVRENNKVVKEQNANPAKGVVVKKDNRQPPAPVPAAALGGPQ